jgi:uncharacterized protein
MIIDVRTIPAGHSVLSQDTGLDALKDELPKLLEKVSCNADIERNGTVFYVHLGFKGVLEQECSRCCNPFPFPFDGDVRLVIKERADKSGKASDDDGGELYYNSRHCEVDLGPVIYEEIQTGLPLKPLCKEECKGIQIAGNEEERTGIDPRWEALAKLKKR